MHDPEKTKAPVVQDRGLPKTTSTENSADATADSSLAQLGAAAAQYLEGEQRAQELLKAIQQGVAHPDALARVVEALATQPDALHGLCRALQKRVEATGLGQ